MIVYVISAKDAKLLLKADLSYVDTLATNLIKKQRHCRYQAKGQFLPTTDFFLQFTGLNPVSKNYRIIHRYTHIS